MLLTCIFTCIDMLRFHYSMEFVQIQVVELERITSGYLIGCWECYIFTAEYAIILNEEPNLEG